MIWNKIELTDDNGNIVSAQTPVIISASRATDIPAFYSDWLINRLEKGYTKWKNPFNGTYSYVSFQNTRLIVFWSKNPRPIIKHLKYLDDKNINYYFQYTLNHYDAEKLEPNVPSLQNRIDTFIELSEKIGKEKVIWRFDPLVLTEEIKVDDLLRKTEYIGNQLKNHTQKMVFSFADIQTYKKVQRNLIKNQVKCIEFNKEQMNQFASGLCQLNMNWSFEIGTCAEETDLGQYGIIHNKCIDDDLIIREFNQDKILMDFLGVKIQPPNIFNPYPAYEKKRSNKDSGQRKLCGCIISKDIGEYDTCPHLCEYCYANASKEIASRNYAKYRYNTQSETIKGE